MMKLYVKTLMSLGAIATVSVAIFMFYRTNNPSVAMTEQWIVINVVNGNSITVRQTDGSEMEVRLCGIDIPEVGDTKASKQIFANQASAKLRSLVAAANNEVMIIPVDKDTDGQTIAEVMTTSKGDIEVSLQEEMLKSGLAYYRQDGTNCPNHIAFLNAQKLARDSKVGVWNQSQSQ